MSRPTIARLESLNACADGVRDVAAQPTLREWWDGTLRIDWMMWLVGRAHCCGSLTRRRLVGVSIACVVTRAHMMPEACLPLLADLQAWADGDDSLDVEATRDAYAYAAAYDAAAYAAAYDADAVAYAAAAYAAADDADAAAAAYAAADAAAAAAADAAAAAARCAMCDVVRDAITIDEVAAALDMDPDAPCAGGAA